ILASFGIVRRAGVKSVRPAFGAAPVKTMEFIDRDAKTVRIAADVVEREQPARNVERRVLEALGHQRPGELLKAHDEMRPAAAILVIADTAQEQKSFDEVDLEQQSGIDFPRLADGIFYESVIGIAEDPGADIAAIDRKKSQHLYQRALQAVQ